MKVLGRDFTFCRDRSLKIFLSWISRFSKQSFRIEESRSTNSSDFRYSEHFDSKSKKIEIGMSRRGRAPQSALSFVIDAFAFTSAGKIVLHIESDKNLANNLSMSPF